MAPYLSSPDPIQGDVGVDHLLLTNGVVGVESAPGGAIARPVQLAAPIPNPSRGTVALVLESFDAGAIQVQIVDASGRLVRHAELSGSAAGHRVSHRREGPAGLTTREVEVLRLAARGLSNKDIASRLVISPKTVANHIEHIYAKIGVSSRAMAGFYAMQNGLLPEEESVPV